MGGGVNPHRSVAQVLNGNLSAPPSVRKGWNRSNTVPSMPKPDRDSGKLPCLMASKAPERSRRVNKRDTLWWRESVLSQGHGRLKQTSPKFVTLKGAGGGGELNQKTVSPDGSLHSHQREINFEKGSETGICRPSVLQRLPIQHLSGPVNKTVFGWALSRTCIQSHWALGGFRLAHAPPLKAAGLKRVDLLDSFPTWKSTVREVS